MGLSLQDLQRMREEMRASLNHTRAELARLEEKIVAMEIKARCEFRQSLLPALPPDMQTAPTAGGPGKRD